MSYIEWKPLEYTTFRFDMGDEFNTAKLYIKDLFAKCTAAGLIRESGMTDSQIDSFAFPTQTYNSGNDAYKMGDCVFSTPVGTGQTTFGLPDAAGNVKITGGTYPKTKIYVKFSFGLYNTGCYNRDTADIFHDIYIDVSVYYNTLNIISFNTFRFHVASAGTRVPFSPSRIVNPFNAFINMNTDGLYINLSPILFGGANDTYYYNEYSINKLNFGIDIFDGYCAVYSHSSQLIGTTTQSRYNTLSSIKKYAFYVGIISENGFNETITGNNVINYSGHYFIANDQSPIKNGNISYQYVYNINHNNSIVPFNNILAIPLSTPTGVPIEIVMPYKGKNVIRTFMCSERDIASPAVYNVDDVTIKNSYLYNIDKITMSI